MRTRETGFVLYQLRFQFIVLDFTSLIRVSAHRKRIMLWESQREQKKICMANWHTLHSFLIVNVNSPCALYILFISFFDGINWPFGIPYFFSALWSTSSMYCTIFGIESVLIYKWKEDVLSAYVLVPTRNLWWTRMNLEYRFLSFL